MQFREDINGLRAIAVIAVVLFHFNADWMPGGFAGVDVFFVISGFLMTGIIFRGMEKKEFSILKFYISRANRIIPALVVLCFVLLIFGWFYLIPLDYKTLGKHAISSMGFLSNLTYWRESGYFDASAHEKWLLHTWSLSVEWQFYIIYPIVLVVMKRFLSLNMMKKIILLGAVLGFALSAIATQKWPIASFFLLPTRAWEMLIGGLAFLYPINFKEKQKKVFGWVGILFIFCSFFLISKETPWPGYLAIFPVLGSYMLIQAQSNNFITCNKVFQNIGDWSYSIYLWHWPFVVAIYYFSMNKSFIYLCIILSVLLGFLSYKYIEKVRLKNNHNNGLEHKYVLAAVVTLLIGASIFFTSGAIYRFPDQIQQKNLSAIEAIDDWGYPASNLKIGGLNIRYIQGSSKENILFIGASHIEHTYPYVESLNTDYNIYYLTSQGCLVTPSYINPRRSCVNIQNYKKLIDEIKFKKIVTSLYVFDAMLAKDNNIRKEQISLRTSEYDSFLKFIKEK